MTNIKECEKTFLTLNL